MNEKQEKNKTKEVPIRKQLNVLYSLIVIFAIVVMSVTFSYSRYIPTWSEIGYQLFGVLPDELNSNYVRFIDVGQGDSILINSNGTTALIDLGPETDDGEELVKSLHKMGVYRIDSVIISHFDSDHIGGDAVLSRMKIGNIIMPEIDAENSSKSFEEYDFATKLSGANIYLAQVGTEIKVGDFTLTIVAYYPDNEDSNDSSVMVMAEIENKSFLFTGDASKKIEERLLDDGYILDCDVFKVAHHGSRYSNSLDFLKAITPDYAVISCAKGNNYGHPHSEVISNLNAINSQVFRTDIKGDITFYIEDGKLKTETEK